MGTGHLSAANRIFPLHLKNDTSQIITFTLTMGNCYQGTGFYAPHKLVHGPLYPGNHVTITLARDQKGCDGQQGVFSVMPSAFSEAQTFNFNNGGGLALSNHPVSYRGELSTKSQDESYTWTLYEKDTRVQHSQIWELRHLDSQEYLTQAYNGLRDDKRNVTVWPLAPNNGFRWVLQKHGIYHTIINLESGLMLTQDSGDRNVSGWGLPTNSHPDASQLWRILSPGYASENNLSMIVNKQSGEGLSKSSNGRNVNTWPGQSFQDPAWLWQFQDAGTADLAKLTIEKITCIRPSTGKDLGTKALFFTIDMAASMASGGSGGAAAAGGKTVLKKSLTGMVKHKAVGVKRAVERKAMRLVTKQGAKDFLKSKVSKKAWERRAVKQTVLGTSNEITGDDSDSYSELIFDQVYGTSPDQLEIRVNSRSVWPNGGRDSREIRSQQTLPVDVVHIIPRRGEFAIQLVEADVGSADDSLGWLVADTNDLVQKERYEDVLIGSESEGSLYAITFTIEPLEPLGPAPGYDSWGVPLEEATPASTDRQEDIALPTEPSDVQEVAEEPYMPVFVPSSPGIIETSEVAGADVTQFTLLNDESFSISIAYIDKQGSISENRSVIPPGESWFIDNGSTGHENKSYGILRGNQFLCTFRLKQNGSVEISRLGACRTVTQQVQQVQQPHLQEAPVVPRDLARLVERTSISTETLAVGFTRDARVMATGGWDNTLTFWDVSGQSAVAGGTIPLAGRGDLLLDLDFSPDGSRVVTGSRQTSNGYEENINVWDVKTGELAVGLQGSLAGFCNYVDYSPDGRYISASCFSQYGGATALQIWDAYSGERILSLNDVYGPVVFSADGSRFAVANVQREEFSLYNSTTAQAYWAIPSTEFKGVHSIAFSASGYELITGNGDGTLKLWDVTTGQDLYTFPGHAKQVNALAFSSNGSLIISGSSDGALKLTSRDTGALLSSAQFPESITSVGFSLSGDRVFSASEDSAVRIFSD